MPQNTHLENISAETDSLPEPGYEAHNPQVLCQKAEQLARTLTWLPNTLSSRTFAERTSALTHALRPIFTALEAPPPKLPISNDFRWLYDNGRLLYTELRNTRLLDSRAKTPHVRTLKGEVMPRALALAEGFLDAVCYEFSEQEFTLFFEAFQRATVLKLQELWTLVSALKLVLLEQIAARGKRLLGDPTDDSQGVAVCVRGLRDIGQTTWRDVLETLTVLDQVLREDPADCYSRMDRDSRDLYRKKVSDIADHSDCTELEVAREASALAQQASYRTYVDPRTALRESHVGYYLVDKGLPLLHRKVGFRPPIGQKIQGFLLRHPDEFFLLGILILTFAIMVAAVLFLTDPSSSPTLVLFAVLILLLPSSQSAVQLMNYLVTSVLPAEILPKL